MEFSQCERLVKILCQKKKIHELVAFIENRDGSISWSKGYNRNIDSPILMASITKLFTTTCILILREQNKLSLDDKLSNYVDKNIVDGLHIYKNKDYSYELTISDLLFQVSGLPDYFLEGKESFEKKVLKEDFYIDFNAMIALGKTMKPNFEPRKKGRSYYTDFNFDLLGKIVENITKLTLAEVYQNYIFTPLNLKSTYIITKETDFAPKIFYKDKSTSVIKFLMSCPASGGGITTARELMVFLKAFWGGKLFDKAVFDQLQEHNCLQITFGGIHYAGGYMYINSGIPFLKKNQLIGHSGSTGSFAFYCPQTGLFFVGDVNQACDPGIPIRLVIRLEMSTRKLAKNL